LKHQSATKKKSMLGTIPQSAPVAKACMIAELPLFSKCIQTRTMAPVRGMTAIRPATDGNFFAIPVATRMMTKLRAVLIRICMKVSPAAQHCVL